MNDGTQPFGTAGKMIPAAVLDFAKKRADELERYSLPTMRMQVDKGMQNRAEMIPRYEAELAELRAFLGDVDVKPQAPAAEANQQIEAEHSPAKPVREKARFRAGDILVDAMNHRYHVIPDGASVAPAEDGSSVLYVSRANRPGSPLTLLERPLNRPEEFGPGDIVRDPDHLVPDGNGNRVPYEGIVGLTPRDAWGNLIVGGSSVHPEPHYELVLKAHHAAPGIPMIALTPELRAILKDLEFCARTEHVPYLDSAQLRVLQTAMTAGEEPAQERPETSLAVQLRLMREGYEVTRNDGLRRTGTIVGVGDQDTFIEVGRQRVVKVPISFDVGRDLIPAVGTIVKIESNGRLQVCEPAMALDADRGA